MQKKATDKYTHLQINKQTKRIYKKTCSAYRYRFDVS